MSSPKKSGSGLSAFGKKPTAPDVAAPVETAPVAAAPASKDVRLAKTVRVTRAQWRRIRELETDTEKTFQTLCLEGLSKIFQEHGLEPL
jgi:hypothetical protein